MTWSYNFPLTANKDKVRFLIGDTDTNDHHVEDEEINYALESEGGVKPAAALICWSQAAKYAKQADKEVDDLRIYYSQKSEAFRELAEQFTSQSSAAAALTVIPSAGGISKTQKQAMEDDTDRVEPAFTRDSMKELFIRPEVDSNNQD